MSVDPFSHTIPSLSADGLPPGRLVGSPPTYWVSEETVEADAWELATAARSKTGLAPAFIVEHDLEDSTPFGQPTSHIGQYDVDAVLRELWNDGLVYDGEVDPEMAELTAPFNGRWPGLSDALPFREDPDELLREHVLVMAGENTQLLLTPAERNADIPGAMAWSGPVNHIQEPVEISVVLRSWEERFGTRILRIGFDTLELTVAAPPTTSEQAIAVAAEHYAFCPDAIHQGYTDTETLAEYAETLLDDDRWKFWWD